MKVALTGCMLVGGGYHEVYAKLFEHDHLLIRSELLC